MHDPVQRGNIFSSIQIWRISHGRETVEKVTTSEIQAERRETEQKSNVQYVSNLAQVVGAFMPQAGRVGGGMREEDSFPNYHICPETSGHLRTLP